MGPVGEISSPISTENVFDLKLYNLSKRNFNLAENSEFQCLMGGQVALHKKQYYLKYCRLTIGGGVEAAME